MPNYTNFFCVPSLLKYGRRSALRFDMKRIIKLIFIVLIIFNPGCKGVDWDDLVTLEDPANVEINGLITLACENPDGIRADGISETTFTATITADATKRKITFKTTSGSFIGASGANTIDVIADADGKAMVTLRVGIKPGNVEVTATIDGYRDINDELTLLPAYADYIDGETSTLFVDKGGSMKANLKAILTRKEGSVSLETEVEFLATQLNEQNEEITVGRFLNKEGERTNDKGIATTTFAADTGDCIVGRQVKIKMVTDKDDGTKLEFDKIRLNVIVIE